MSLQFHTYIFWIQIATALFHSCAGIPILYPANEVKTALVEDLTSGEVVSVQGAFGKFLCSDNDSGQLPFTNAKCSDSEDAIVLRTPNSIIRLALNDVDVNGETLPMEQFESILPQINATDAVATIDPTTPISRRLSETTIKVSQEGVPIKISWRNRSIVVVWDSTSPEEELSTRPSKGLQEDPPYTVFLAGFTERVVPRKACSAGLPRLQPPETVSTLLEKASKCSQDLTKASFESAYSVTKANRSEAEYDKEGNLLIVTAYPDPAPVPSPTRQILVFRIISGKLMDYAGNELAASGSSVGVGYTPPKLKKDVSTSSSSEPITVPPTRVETVNETKPAESVGKAATAVMAATAVTSVGGTIVAATAVTGGGGGAMVAPSTGGLINLLNMGQKLFLLGNLAVKDLPLEFKAFSSQLKWTMLDTEAPWEPEEDERRGSRAGSSSDDDDDDAGGDDDDGKGGDDDGGEGGDDDAGEGGDDDASEIAEDTEVDFEVENRDVLDDDLLGNGDSDDELAEFSDDIEQGEVEMVPNRLNSFSDDEDDDIGNGGDSDDEDRPSFLEQGVFPPNGISTVGLPRLPGIAPESNGNSPTVGIPESPPVEQGSKNENTKNEISKRRKMPKESEKAANENASSGATNAADGIVNTNRDTSQDLNSGNSSQETPPEHPKDEFARGKFQQVQDLGDIIYEGDPHRALRRVLFWVSIIHAVLFVVHVMIVIFLRVKKYEVPTFLYFPRMEIYIAYWTMPAVATACAGLFQGDSGDKLLGAFILLLLPGSFLLVHVVIIYLHFIKKNPMEWEARVLLSTAALEPKSVISKQLARPSVGETSMSQILEEPIRYSDASTSEASQQENGSISQAHAHQVKISVDPHSKPPDTKVPEKQQNTGSWFKNIIVQAGKQALSSIDRLLFRFWVGPPLEKAEWTKTHPKNNLLDQFGPMFEDCRGVRMVMTRPPTYTLDPDTGKFDRGEYEPLIESIPFMGDRSPLRMHHLQVFATTANFVKLIAFAIIIGAEDNDESLSQLILLLLISSSFITFFRVSRPYLTRHELALALLAEGADIVTFILGVCLILGPSTNKSFRRNLGLGMLWIEGIAFGLLLFEKFLTISMFIGEQLLEKIRNRSVRKARAENLTNALWKVMTTHPGYLEKKYSHRWMLCVLGKGLTGRVLVSDERKFLKKKSKKQNQFSFKAAASFIKDSTKFIR